jgi:predicted O-methyltransferase YrrM
LTVWWGINEPVRQRGEDDFPQDSDVTVDSDVLETVPGWFGPTDQALFRWFLSRQVASGHKGDLAELGVYMGKSAILIGDYLQRPGEAFTVIDLFEEVSDEVENRAENERTYANLTQRSFEAHYLRFHAQLPRIVRGDSRSITEHARVGSHRFVHVDASHLYEHVRADAESAKRLLSDNGVVVFDDIRSLHTPGVAAAVWEEILKGGLRVLVSSENKLYGTWSDPTAWLDGLRAWLPASGLEWEQQEIAGRPFLRAWASPVRSQTRRAAEALTPPALLWRVDRARELRQAGRSIWDIARMAACSVSRAIRSDGNRRDQAPWRRVDR